MSLSIKPAFVKEELMKPNDAVPSFIDIIHMLVRTTHAIQKEFDAQLGMFPTPYQVSGPRLRVLSVVLETGSIRMNELAARLGIKARTLTDLVDALEKEQLLVRVQDPQDRRAILIQLTEQAQATIRPVLDYQTEIAEKILGSLTESDRRVFYDMLLSLSKNKDLSACIELK
jgi:DNA-binding MarR family transcriptional regulator